MKIDFIQFKLSMHYENWEFDLEFEDSSETYDMYRYIKNDIKEVLGFEVADIFLYFNMDTLFQVEVYLYIEEVGLMTTKLLEYFKKDDKLKGLVQSFTLELSQVRQVIDGECLFMNYNEEVKMLVITHSIYEIWYKL